MKTSANQKRALCSKTVYQWKAVNFIEQDDIYKMKTPIKSISIEGNAKLKTKKS